MLRVWARIIRVIDLASAICVVAMVSIVAVQIFLRYVLNHPFVWADELANWLFVWVIYLGATVLVRYDAHLTVEIVTDRLSPRVNRWRKLIVNIVVLAFLVLLLWETVALLQKFGTTASAAMGVPMALFFGCGFIFAAVSVVEYFRQIVALLVTIVSGSDAGGIAGAGPDGRDLREAVKL